MYSLAYYFPNQKEYVRAELVESDETGRILTAIYPLLNFQVSEELMKQQVRILSKQLRFNYFSFYSEDEMEALAYAMNHHINAFLAEQERAGKLISSTIDNLTGNQIFELYYGKQMVVTDDGICLTNPFTYLYNVPTNVKH